MIQANELRIGNYIVFNEDDAISKVIGIHTDIDGVDVQIGDEETYIELRQFSGIELTEEILLKCGFDKVNEFEGYADKKHCLLRTGDFYLFMPFCTEDKDCYIEIKHLHQLQNLFHSLTGQELNVKL